MFVYIPNLFATVVEQQSARHLFSLRVNPGDVLTATDLAGSLANIKILKYNKDTMEVEFEMLEKTLKKLPKPDKVLIQALIDKNYIDKLLEVVPLANIGEVYFYPSKRSNLSELSLDRFTKILIRSAEQSEKTWLTKLKLLDLGEAKEMIQSLKPVVMEFNPESGNSQNKSSLLSNSSDNLSVLVGPEGGWEEFELTQFKKFGLEFGSLPNGVLPAWIAGYSWFAK